MADHDLVVIGAGPAGLTAGIYAGRSRLSTRVIEMMMPGGQAAITHLIENYPGVSALSGSELAARMQEQMQGFGAELISDTVTSIEQSGDHFTVALGSGPMTARAIIIASGTGYKKLGVPGEEEFAGRGVSYCATCDGPLYRGQEVAVVGGGDSALQEALYLTSLVKKVYLIHRRDEFRAVPVLGERVRAHEGIECVFSHVVESIEGSGAGVEHLVLNPVAGGEARVLGVHGVFLFVGLKPKTEFLGDLIEKNEWGFLAAGEDTRTNIPGICAAGDCRDKPLRQIATAVGDGATAVHAVERYLDDGEW
jgi:thioredoxin reductase (NADPH)